MARYDWFVVRISDNEIMRKCATKHEAALFVRTWGKKEYKVSYIDDYKKELNNETVSSR